MQRSAERACRPMRSIVCRTSSFAGPVPVRFLSSEHNKASPPQIPPFNYSPKPYNGPSADQVLNKRTTFLGPSLFHYYKKPINIVEGKMQYLFDESGRRYLDAFAGIVTVSCGHCHPDVVEAVMNQSRLLQHTSTIYLHHAIADFAEALASKMPGNLKVVYFVNSGSEANELATLMARLYSGNHDMISLRNAYHGGSAGTMGLTAVSTWKYNIAQGGFHHVLNPNPYRGIHGSDGKKYANDVKEHIEYGTSGRIAGFISETIQGVGGAVELAPGYLPAVYKHVRDAGGVCIADEVQTGFGRTGSHYWGFETQGVIPDLVTMAKGIGNGLPLGAVVTTPEIASVMKGKIHFNTFGGNPVCSAGGIAVLKVIDREKRQEHCSVVGNHLLSRLRTLQEKYEIIGDVRGRGLMVGVELVTDRDLKTPAKNETNLIFEKLKDLGILIGKGGLHSNNFRIKPPMCFTKEDAGLFNTSGPFYCLPRCTLASAHGLFNFGLQLIKEFNPSFNLFKSYSYGSMYLTSILRSLLGSTQPLKMVLSYEHKEEDHLDKMRSFPFMGFIRLRFSNEAIC